MVVVVVDFRGHEKLLITRGRFDRFDVRGGDIDGIYSDAVGGGHHFCGGRYCYMFCVAV